MKILSIIYLAQFYQSAELSTDKASSHTSQSAVNVNLLKETEQEVNIGC